MSRPLIGVTTYARNEKREFTLPSEYVEAVRRAGAAAVLLPPGEEHLDRWLSAVDGVILTGGGDIEPETYGGRRHETLYMTDAERDRTELDLTQRILDSGMPTLAICRGVQILNVALGGTLHEHLPDTFGESVLHRKPPRDPTPHQISVAEGSKLASILGATEFTSASWHHQAIREAAPGLEVVAHAPDGVIEAVEDPQHPWLYAVQWHPELTAADDPIQQRLFDALAEASRCA